jgi:hypothetical protein
MSLPRVPVALCCFSTVSEGAGRWSGLNEGRGRKAGDEESDEAEEAEETTTLTMRTRSDEYFASYVVCDDRETTMPSKETDKTDIYERIPEKTTSPLFLFSLPPSLAA